MPPRAFPSLFVTLLLACLAAPALSAAPSASKSSSLLRRSTTRTGTRSHTSTRTCTSSRTHSKGWSASNSRAPQVFVPALPSSSNSLSESPAPSLTPAPSVTASITPSESLTSSETPTLSVTPTFSPTFFLSRCTSATLTVYPAADCTGTPASFTAGSGCLKATLASKKMNVLFAVNNGVPYVSLFATLDTSCSNAATATYPGALGVCINQGATSYVLTCANLATETATPSPPPSTSSTIPSDTSSASPSMTPSASTIFSSAPNPYLCNTAVVKVFSSKDCTGYSNWFNVDQAIAPGAIAATGLVAGTWTCAPLAFLGRSYFAAYTRVRGVPTVTLYSNADKCAAALAATVWTGLNPVPPTGGVWGGKAQYTGAFNTCQQSAWASFIIGCSDTGAGATASFSSAPFAPTSSATPSPKAYRCAAVTVQRFTLSADFDAASSCVASNTNPPVTFTVSMGQCSGTPMGKTALLFADSAAPSTTVRVAYYPSLTACAADQLALATKGVPPSNFLTSAGYLGAQAGPLDASCALQELWVSTPPAGIATTYSCQWFTSPAAVPPSASAAPHPALCAALSVLTYPPEDRDCSTPPFALSFPYEPLTADGTAINPFSPTSATTECLSTTILDAATYYTITIPAASSFVSCIGTFLAYAPTVTTYGTDSTCNAANIDTSFDYSYIETLSGGSHVLMPATSGNQAWGKLGPDQATSLCFGHGIGSAAPYIPTDHYQIVCSGVIAPSASPTPAPSPCSSAVIVSVFTQAAAPILLPGGGTIQAAAGGCKFGPYYAAGTNFASNYVGNFTVPVKCGPVTYGNAFPRATFDLVSNGILGSVVFGSVDASGPTPTVNLFGGTLGSAGWGYNPDIMCSTGFTTTALSNAQPLVLGSLPAPASANGCSSLVSALGWAGTTSTAKYYYTFTCANMVSATPSPTTSISATISLSPYHRLRRE